VPPEGAPAPVRCLELRGLGGLPRELGVELASQLSRRVALPCRLGEGLDDLTIPWMDERSQVDADRLLGLLEQRDLPPGTVLVGVTTLDIGNPIFSFFFGLAHRGGRAALVSLARLDPVFYGLDADPALTLERAVREVLHEVGHVAGLGHCHDNACVMHFASAVELIDVRGEDFCDNCAVDLPGSFGSGARHVGVNGS